jgi:voltage-gated potassium channel
MNWLILSLSIYVLGALFVDTVFDLPIEVSVVLQATDTAICFIFLGDFLLRFYRAPNRLAFMRWGWLDLISSVPMVDIFRWGRIYRVVRVLRILRGVRSARHILRILFENRAKGTFGAVAVISLVLVIFSSVAILNVEPMPTPISKMLAMLCGGGVKHHYPPSLTPRSSDVTPDSLTTCVLNAVGLGVWQFW